MGRFFPKNEKITPTSRDPYLAGLERENIISLLNSNFNTLEIGCGDATHTIEYSKHLNHIDGLDVSNSLIKRAKKKAENILNITLESGSVLDVNEIYRSKVFDCIISQRCLINLPDWESQKDAIIKLQGLLVKGGLFLVTEGFDGELKNLNHLRVKNNLEPIKVVDYNKNFERKSFEIFIRKYFEILEVRNYGAYLFFSRLYHPLIVYPEKPKHDSAINRIAKELSLNVDQSKFEEYSYNIFYVLRKPL